MANKEALKNGTWRDLVVQEAAAWKFTPYQHKGRVKGVGVDCGGLLYEVYSPLLGPFKAFPQEYPADWAAHKEGHELYLDFIMPYVQEVEKVKRGGFSLFHYGRNWSHAAIWTGNSYIHAYGRNNVGFVKESPIGFFFAKNGKLRPTKHFDVSERWLSQFLSPSQG